MFNAAAEVPSTLFTIGHSTRTIQGFVHLLQMHGVTRVVDVRSIPRSRHNPQFNLEVLPRSLSQAGVGYVHLPSLGGLRRAMRNSRNLGWRNPMFRGFADYMQTPDFGTGLAELLRHACSNRVAVLCAEAVPWVCHRSLIADALLVRGIRTEHILSATHRQPHTLTPFAQVQADRVVYPAQDKPAELR